MPITVTWPAANTPFGPGHFMFWTSSFIGPMPTGTVWDLTLRLAPPEELTLARMTIPWVNASQNATMSITNGIPTFVEPGAGAVTGAPAQLFIRLLEGGTTTIDQITVPVTLDLEQGVLFQLQTQIQGITGGGQGGFNAQDRVVLQDMSVQMNAWLLWDLIGELIEPVASLIGTIIRTAPERSLVGDVTGFFRFDIPPENPLWQWVGMDWALVVKPIGVGLDEGNPPLTEIDYAQIELTRRASDGTYRTYEGLYTRKTEQAIYWGTQNPDRITGFVMPGHTVRFWLIQQRAPVARVEEASQLEAAADTQEPV